MPIYTKKSPNYDGTSKIINFRGSGGGLNLKSSPSSSPPITTLGLSLYLDAGNTSSYPGSGTTWLDLSGNNNTATLFNPSFSPLDGGYIDFGSDFYSNRYATVNLNSSLRPTTGLTQACWAKLNRLDNLMVAMAIQYGTESTNSYALYTIGGSWHALVNTGTAIETYNGPALTSLTWSYITHTYDGSFQKTYINGVEITDVRTPSAGTIIYNSNNTKFTIGSNFDGSGYDVGPSGRGFGGMGELHFYNRPLSDSEILSNFNNTKSRYGL